MHKSYVLNNSKFQIGFFFLFKSKVVTTITIYHIHFNYKNYVFLFDIVNTRHMLEEIFLKIVFIFNSIRCLFKNGKISIKKMIHINFPNFLE